MGDVDVKIAIDSVVGGGLGPQGLAGGNLPFRSSAGGQVLPKKPIKDNVALRSCARGSVGPLVDLSSEGASANVGATGGDVVD